MGLTLDFQSHLTLAETSHKQLAATVARPQNKKDKVEDCQLSNRVWELGGASNTFKVLAWTGSNLEGSSSSDRA